MNAFLKSIFPTGSGTLGGCLFQEEQSKQTESVHAFGCEALAC